MTDNTSTAILARVYTWGLTRRPGVRIGYDLTFGDHAVPARRHTASAQAKQTIYRAIREGLLRYRDDDTDRIELTDAAMHLIAGTSALAREQAQLSVTTAHRARVTLITRTHRSNGRTRAYDNRRATCSCGWEADVIRETAPRAEKDAAEHLAPFVDEVAASGLL